MALLKTHAVFLSFLYHTKNNNMARIDPWLCDFILEYKIDDAFFIKKGQSPFLVKTCSHMIMENFKLVGAP